MQDQNADRAEAPRRQLPRYKSHKLVWALKIKAIEQAPADQDRRHPDGDWLLIPEDASYFPVCVGHSYVLKHKPQPGGYYVTYNDGYESYSPAMAFEEGYTSAEPLPSTEAAVSAISTAPRVTPADIEANIVSEHCFTAGEGAYGAAARGPKGGEGDTFGWQEPPALGLLTICVLVLRNGFTVTGESACASPENFNAEIGKRIARENAIEKLWPLMGYQLKEQLYQRIQPAQAPKA